MKPKRHKADSWGIAKRIQFCRNLQGATQSDISAVANLDRVTYAKIESGIRRPSAMELDAIAKALYIDIRDLLEMQPLEKAIPAIFVELDDDIPA